MLAVFAAKATVLAQLHDHPLLQPTAGLDSAAYVELGGRVANGDLLLGPEPFYLAPLYAYFLGLVFALTGGSLVAPRVVQIVLGTLAVALVERTARHWYGRAAARVAAVLVALTGVLTFNEVLLLQSALDPFLTALGLAVLAWALAGGGWRRFAVAGAAIGLHALNRPNVLLWGGALVVLLLAGLGSRGPEETAAASAGGEGAAPRIRRHPVLGALRAGLPGAAAVALGLSVALLPSTLRNRLASDEWILVSSHGGLNLYIGNNAQADGTYRSLPGITPDVAGQARDATRLASEALGHPATAGEASSWFRDRALAWIRENPLDALRLWLRKLGLVLNAQELRLNYAYAYFSQDEPTLLRLLPVGAWLLVPLGLVGLLVDSKRRAPGYALWAAFVPVYAVSVALFFVNTRYRLPLLLPLAAGSGALLVAVAESVRERAGRRLAAVVLAVGVIAAVAWRPTGLDDGRAATQEDRIVQLIEAGRQAEARDRLAAAEATHPRPAVLLFRAGRALALSGAAAEALPLLERARRHDPASVEIRFALGEVLLDLGRAAEAVPHLRAAFDAGVRRDLAGFDLARALAATGAVEEARATLTALADLKLDPDSAAAVARLALDLGAPALALRFLDAATLEAPRRVELVEQRGLVLAQLGRDAEALAAFEVARRLDPARASLYLNAAVLLAQAGRVEEARATLRQALVLRPDYAQARALLERLGG